MKLTSVMLLCAVALGAHPASAATVWDESVNGDLSNDGLSPTAVSMASGHNVVNGVTGNPGNGVDRDYFRFTVPAGFTLSLLNLLGNTSVSGNVSFIAIQPGSQVTVTPTGGGVEKLIALGHYGNDQIGANLLPSIMLGGATTLAAGVYSVWIQDTSGVATYGLDFVLTPAVAASTAGAATDGPLPIWALASAGAALIAIMRKRRATTRARSA